MKSLLIPFSFALAVAALATPHAHPNPHHHRAIAARVADAPAFNPVAPTIRRRANGKRCRPRPASSSVVLSSSAVPTPVQNVAHSVVHSSSSVDPPATTSTHYHAPSSSTHHEDPTPTTVATPTPPTTSKATPTTSKAAPTTSSSLEHKPTTNTQSVVKPTTTQQAAPTTQALSGGNLPSFMTGIQTGQGTYYTTGLGACGIVNTDSDYIAAVSRHLFDIYPGWDGANPNNNPVCNKAIKATYNGRSVTVRVTDRCEACAITDLDFSPSAFKNLADFDVGRISGMQWVWQ